MAEQEPGAERLVGDEAVVRPAGGDPDQGHGTTERPKAQRLVPRPDDGLPFGEALDETMRDHRAVFAALAR